jgi:hypothetical protein
VTSGVMTGGKRKPSLAGDELVAAGFLTKADAEAHEPVYARALAKRGLARRFGVYVAHVGGGAGWGIFVGPLDKPREVTSTPARKRRRKPPDSGPSGRA